MNSLKHLLSQRERGGGGREEKALDRVFSIVNLFCAMEYYTSVIQCIYLIRSPTSNRESLQKFKSLDNRTLHW